MKPTGRNNSLRLVRMVAENTLRERILLKDEVDRSAMTLIAEQTESIVEAMQAEWESDPASAELREGFRLLIDYIRLIKHH